ncbi:MAG: terpene cyclase/mutase family protein [Planctomycetaceae bacterium]|nr:terpene cyclase/mutase family protein [Planctomycetaceae bacterium]MCB9951578.1 terpene cyclase/mutase family protein [Planctomycetaceae bacterium]
MSASPDTSEKKRTLRVRKSMVELQRRFSWSHRLWQDLKAGWKGALVSFAVHALLFLVLGIVVFKIIHPDPMILYMGWATVVDDAEEEEDKEPVVQPIHIPSLGMSRPSESQNTTPEPNPDNQQPVERPGVNPVSVANSLQNRPTWTGNTREGGPKDEDLRKSLDAALKWIVRQQQADGHWSLTGPYPDAGTVETDTGATALALLCLLGDGNTHENGMYSQQVNKGIQWLIAQQHPDGDLFDILEQGREAHFYSHAQATIVLCEALALTHDPALRPPAEKAVEFLVRAQNPKWGGWKYRPLSETGIGDLSVTGWVLMALHTARMADIEVDLETYRLADLFITSVQENEIDGSHYKYRPDLPAEESQRLSMTAEGLLCRQWLGWPKDNFDLKRGVNFLQQEQNRPEWLAHRRNVYAWYYIAQTLHNLGGPLWEQWFPPVQQMILSNQISAGPTTGSWHPHRPEGAFHERSHDAGRLYMTAMCVLILETPQRHAPVYDSGTE